jgi:zinc/manganese transport system ATP-binding protein
VDAALLSHLYGTPIRVAHTPQGEFYMRTAL